MLRRRIGAMSAYQRACGRRSCNPSHGENRGSSLVRRFLPKADQSTLIMAAVWLVGQCAIFVRNREQLTNPPVSLALDGAAIERLTTLVSAWALAGLAAAA
jgi:hypothetical protein